MEVSQRVRTLCIDGFKLLSEWSAKIHEMLAWKLARPASVDNHDSEPINPKVFELYNKCCSYISG